MENTSRTERILAKMQEKKDKVSERDINIQLSTYTLLLTAEICELKRRLELATAEKTELNNELKISLADNDRLRNKIAQMASCECSK